MPDAPANVLARHLLTALPPERPHGRADLARLPLPVAHYLGGVLDRRLAREAALPASAWFDGEADAVEEAARAWRAATRDTARFPADEWADTAHEAARRVLGYLVEPAEALTAHVFADDDEDALPIEAVRARMAAFSPYPYLREIAEGYFARKGIEAITRDDFERLLRRIDRRMVSLFGPHDWLSLLEPLFDLLRPLAEGGLVPASLLRRFFEAKGYDDLAHALDADAYDPAALRAALTAALPDLDAEEDVPTAAEPPGIEEPEAETIPAEADTEESEDAERDEPGAEAEEPEEIAAPEPAVDEPEAVEEAEEEPEPVAPSPPPPVERPSPEAEAAPEPESPEPLWMRLAREREATAPAAETPPAPAPEEAAPAAAPAAPEPEAEPEAEPEPLWKRFATGATGPADPSGAPAPARPAEPLARLETRVLGPSATERRDWFVTNLTGGSEAAYRAVLAQLDAAPSWTVASQIIAREVFRKHQVNIYSDAAVAFTDAAEARFVQGR